MKSPPSMSRRVTVEERHQVELTRGELYRLILDALGLREKLPGFAHTITIWNGHDTFTLDEEADLDEDGITVVSGRVAEEPIAALKSPLEPAPQPLGPPVAVPPVRSRRRPTLTTRLTCIYADCVAGGEQASAPFCATCASCRARWALDPASADLSDDSPQSEEDA